MRRFGLLSCAQLSLAAETIAPQQDPRFLPLDVGLSVPVLKRSGPRSMWPGTVVTVLLSDARCPLHGRRV
jgi:hypothetical protein